MSEAAKGERPSGPPGDDLLAAWLAHEDALWARLSVEPRRVERRALWRALAYARRLLDRIDPARGGDADATAGAIVGAADLAFKTRYSFPPSVDEILASREDEWDALLDQLGEGAAPEPDAAP